MKNIVCSLSVILSILIVSELSAKPLGRLFTTPSERAMLDKIRNNYKFGKTIFERSDQQKPIKRKRKAIVFNGVVHRNTGEKVIWVNGKKLNNNKSIDKSTHSKTSILVKHSNSKHYISVQPGQIVDRNSGKIVEPYQSLIPTAKRNQNAVKVKK